MPQGFVNPVVCAGGCCFIFRGCIIFDIILTELTLDMFGCIDLDDLHPQNRTSTCVTKYFPRLSKTFLTFLDVSTSMTYIPGTGPQPVFPASHLTLCPASCGVAHLETSLTLHTDHVGVGCDRDTYSLQSQRKMCGASNQAVELLPAVSGTEI